MKYLKSDSESVIRTAEALKAKKIVIIPTDTVYGFSGIVSGSGDVGNRGVLDCDSGKSSCSDISCINTDERIRHIKGREAYKPFIQLISAPEDIKLITDDPIPDELFSLWPGALTIIVNDKRYPCDKDGKKTTVAVRCPGDAWLRDVIRETGSAIYSTSVNRSGKPVLSDIADIVAEFGDEVDVIIDDGDKRNALPSTIVSVADGKCTVIRQGSIVIADTLIR